MRFNLIVERPHSLMFKFLKGQTQGNDLMNLYKSIKDAFKC